MTAGALLKDRALVCVAVCAALLAALSLALTPHGMPLSPDAVEYAGVARNLVRGRGFTIDFVEFHPGLLPAIRHPLELHGLLTPLFLAPLFAVWGPSSALVRVPGVLALAGLVVATFVLGRQTFGTRAGLLSALATALRFDLIGDALFGGDDVGWALFSTLSVAYFIRSLKTGGRRALYAAGWFAAAATLQKYTGILLPFVFGVAAVVTSRTVHVRPRDAVLVAGPAALAATAYALKNHSIHGGLGFRFGAVDWLSRENIAAYFAYYDSPPKLGSVWAHMGAPRVLELVGAEVRTLWRAALGDPVTTFGGLSALVWARKREPAFAWIGLAYTAGLAVALCVFYHVEFRYLFALVPIYVVALSGLVVAAFDALSARIGERRVPYLRAGVTVMLALLSTALMLAIVKGERLFDQVATGKDPCDDAIQFIRKSVPADDAIFTNGPGELTWSTGHPSVVAPSNGVAALSKIAQHYGVRWAMTTRADFGHADLEADLRALARDSLRPRPTLVFDGVICDVYGLEP